MTDRREPATEAGRAAGLREAPDQRLRALLAEGFASAGPSGSLNLDHRWWRDKARALATEGEPQRDMTAGEWRGAYMELARICEEKIGAVERVARQAMTGIHARDRHSGFWQECPVDYCEAGGLDRGPLPAGSFLATEREPQNRTHVPWCRYDRDHRGRCNEFATEGEPTPQDEDDMDAMAAGNFV